MLCIRPDQIHALEAAATDRVVVDIVAHMRRFWPRVAAEMAEEAFEARVRTACERARRYAFRSPADQARFVNITFALGEEFHTDPLYPWAGEILQHPTLEPFAKLAKLHELTLRELNEE